MIYFWVAYQKLSLKKNRILNAQIIKKTMKVIIKYSLIFAIPIIFGHQISKAQSTDADIIFNAMSDELNRNISNLALNEYKPPFFIAYRLIEGNSLYIK